jgi:hypothetical protein
MASLILVLVMYNNSLMSETTYRLIAQGGYCAIMFALTSAKIKNA